MYLVCVLQCYPLYAEQCSGFFPRDFSRVISRGSGRSRDPVKNWSPATAQTDPVQIVISRSPPNWSRKNVDIPIPSNRAPRTNVKSRDFSVPRRAKPAEILISRIPFEIDRRVSMKTGFTRLFLYQASRSAGYPSLLRIIQSSREIGSWRVRTSALVVGASWFSVRTGTYE